MAKQLRSLRPGRPTTRCPGTTNVFAQANVEAGKKFYAMKVIATQRAPTDSMVIPYSQGDYAANRRSASELNKA